MFGWGKKPDLAEESDVFLSVHQALEGNFELVKPLSCQPPSTRRADDTYLLQHTEDQLESSLLSTETAGYNTARAADEQWFDTVKTVQSLEEDSDSDYNEAEPYPEEEEPAAAAVLPEKTKSVLIYQNSSGKFRRFKSDLAWAHNASDKNRNNCLDCAAQISCCDMTSEGGTTSAPNSMTVQTSYQERTTENFESSRLDQHSITEESTHSQSTIRDIRKSSISNNGCPSDCSFSKVRNSCISSHLLLLQSYRNQTILLSCTKLIWPAAFKSGIGISCHDDLHFAAGFTYNRYWSSCDEHSR